MRESYIESKVCEYARKKGWLTRKYTSPGHAGVPDRIFFNWDGRILFIEFKAPGEKPRPLQEREHARLRERGFLVFVVDDIDEGKRLVDNHS